MNKKLIKGISLGVLLSTLGTTNAMAMSGFFQRHDDPPSRAEFREYVHNHFAGCVHDKKTEQVPELDGAGAGIALGLVASLIALRRERKRPPRKDT